MSTFPKMSETFIVSKFLGLLERGWDVHVVTQDSSASRWAACPDLAGREDLKRRVHVSWPHRPRWLAILLAPLALLRCAMTAPLMTLRYLHRGIRLFGFSVVRMLYFDAELICCRPEVVHFEFGALAVGRMYLADLLNCAITVSFRGYDLNYVGLETPEYYAEVWQKAAAVHVLGEDLWKRAVRRGCPPGKPHALISPAVDSKVFDGDRASTRSGDPFRILSVGRLEWKKGYEDALVAVRDLVGRGIRCEYKIAGDGDFIEALAFARHQLALEGVVTFLGPVSRDEIKSWMKWADVLLHAAVSEGFCNAVLEAQSMRLAVVCTDADGLRENVQDGVTGLVVHRGDPGGLSAALETMAREPELRREMGEAGRQRVTTHFRLQEQAEAFHRFYDDVVSLANPRGEEAVAISDGTGS